MTIQIDKIAAGKTIRDYLRVDLGYSGGMLKRLKFMEGGITVNGKFVTVRYVLQEGDCLGLRMDDRPEDTCPYMIPVDLPLKIAYEDAYLTAVDKPPAMPAHPSHSHRLDTVANALAFRYAHCPYQIGSFPNVSAYDPGKHPKIIHRHSLRHTHRTVRRDLPVPVPLPGQHYPA